MIDPGTIDRVFNTVQIVDVVQDFITLKKRGVNYLGLCPFHNEKTPSFTVSPAKGIYKCFGCSKGGNAVNFVMDHEQLTYTEAIRYLAKKYNIEIVEKERDAEEIKQETERESMLVVNTFAQKTFSRYLFDTDEGRAIGLSYFKERGFREDVIQLYQLGYALEGRDAFTREAQKNGYKLEYLVKTGLTIKGETSSFDRFSGRVMFPIHALTGKVIGFGGRILKTDKKTAKYLNSPESDIYHKSFVLYGLYQARKAIVQEDRCYLVEGYTDVLSMHQAGIENVVASSGTSLTQDQIRLIHRFTPNVTIIYDGDSAGIKASLRGIDLILEQGLNVKVVPLPEGEDPDSWSRKLSSSELKKYIQDNETDFIVFKTRVLLDEAEKDPIKKAGLITEIVKSISVIPDKIIRSVYIRECSRLLDTDEAVIYSEVYKLRREKAESHFKKTKNDESAHIRSTTLPAFIGDVYSEPQEKELIRLLLLYGTIDLFQVDESGEYITVGEYIINEILNDELQFKNLVYQKIFEEYKQLIEKGDVKDNYFIHNPDPSISSLAVDIYTPRYTLSKLHTKKGAFIETEDMKLKQDVPRAIILYKRKILEIARSDIENRLKETNMETSLESIQELLGQSMLISSAIREISKEQGWVILK